MSSLLIVGNALAFYGYPRNTLNIDFLISVNTLQKWESLLMKFGYEKFHATGAFAQFKAEGAVPLDLMIVDNSTWEKLEEATGGNFNLQVRDLELAGRHARR